MADYFLVLDRTTFEGQLRPPLAEAWRRRSFSPCRHLARAWSAAALDFARRYRVNPDDLLLPRLDGLAFDRSLWRGAVGELFQVAALEAPEVPAHLDSLAHLLAGHPPAGPAGPRDTPPFQQALHGSRDLTFGLATYRPGHAGYNDAGDVARLAAWFASARPDAWTPADLAGLPGLDEPDRDEELAFAREWFTVLADLYARAARAGHVIALESAS